MQKNFTYTSGISVANIPEWQLTKGITLYEWQTECRDKYCGNGIAKVVTGVGKTILAFSIIESLHNHLCSALKVLIVVPTIVLMRQWYAELLEHGNIPKEHIGLLYGGKKDLPGIAKQIVIGVCNTVALWHDKIDIENLLLVADECHRYAGEKVGKCLDVRHAYSLGLSATPESNTSSNALSIISKKIGKIFFSLDYGKAMNAGYLPFFEIHHIGLPLTQKEQTQYAILSDKISELTKRILSSNFSIKKTNLLAFAIKKCKEEQQGAAGIYSKYISLITQRKNLLYSAKSRTSAVDYFLKKITRDNPSGQIIVFHERIDEINKLGEHLKKQGYLVGVEHSELPFKKREKNIEKFRAKKIQILISGRSLIEGFDAPAAEIGISMASSASRTKVVQAIGRILRKSKTSKQKNCFFYKFYMSGTIDETIYEEIDFAKLTGAEHNHYYLFEQKDSKSAFFEKEVFSPPRSRLMSMAEIDWGKVTPGTIIRFVFEGEKFQIDELDNVFKRENAKKIYIANPQNILSVIAPYRGQMVNNFVFQSPEGYIFVHATENKQDKSLMFCGTVREEFVFDSCSLRDEQFKLVKRKDENSVQYVHRIDGMKYILSGEYSQIIFSAIEMYPALIQCQLHRVSIFDKRKVYVWMKNKRYLICTLPGDWDCEYKHI